MHFGSLTSALGSFLEARARQGTWALRIENVDRTREVPGAAELIIRTLEQIGFEWDGPIVYQSDRTENYAAALDRLRRDGMVYDCSCSRSEIEANARGSAPAADEVRYPGTCRLGPLHPERPLATRFRTSEQRITFVDVVQGSVSQDVQSEIGDFVVRRRDRYFAYQLAVVVDDAELGVTQVVRGADLLDNTPRQLLLQQALGLPISTYAHLPLAVDANGAKLSKTAQSVPIDASRGTSVLWQALDFLKQAPPDSLARAPASELWQWAFSHWDLSRLRGVRVAPAPAP